MIDIDCFKDYNDNYGHASGDECLQNIAHTLCKSIQRSGDFLARYGGEEFVVILPETDISSAVEVAETLRKNVESLKIPHEKNHASDYVTISLGSATILPKLNLNFDTIIEAADKCLYNSKNNRKNRVTSKLIEL